MARPSGRLTPWDVPGSNRRRQSDAPAWPICRHGCRLGCTDCESRGSDRRWAVDGDKAGCSAAASGNGGPNRRRIFEAGDGSRARATGEKPRLLMEILALRLVDARTWRTQDPVAGISCLRQHAASARRPVSRSQGNLLGEQWANHPSGSDLATPY